jgi:hypothetical protein
MSDPSGDDEETTHDSISWDTLSVTFSETESSESDSDDHVVEFKSVAIRNHRLMRAIQYAIGEKMDDMDRGIVALPELLLLSEDYVTLEEHMPGRAGPNAQRVDLLYGFGWKQCRSRYRRSWPTEPFPCTCAEHLYDHDNFVEIFASFLDWRWHHLGLIVQPASALHRVFRDDDFWPHLYEAMKRSKTRLRRKPCLVVLDEIRISAEGLESLGRDSLDLDSLYEAFYRCTRCGVSGTYADIQKHVRQDHLSTDVIYLLMERDKFPPDFRGCPITTSQMVEYERSWETPAIYEPPLF